MTFKQRVCLPERYAVIGKVHKNAICQLHCSQIDQELEVKKIVFKSGPGLAVGNKESSQTIIIPKKIKTAVEFQQVLLVSSESALTNPEIMAETANEAQWLKPLPVNINCKSIDYWESYCKSIRESWKGKFTFLEEQVRDGKVVLYGLRPPQIGALHAILAHWKVTESPATIVMPTGTGKTETMLSLLACQQLERLLVVVPTNSLREQISQKFITFGLLKKLRVLEDSALFPLVTTLNHRPKTKKEVDDLLRASNVIVATMSVLSGCTEEVQKHIAGQCSHLFVDEAHHAPAPTWDNFRQKFQEKPILQFTATPFRTDGKQVDGKIIFNYPLKKAQVEGYFKPINFRPVREFLPKNSDMAIARAAIEQLADDLSQNFDHLMMVRASTIERAEHLHHIYTAYAPEHNPLLIHSKTGATAAREVFQKIYSRQSRIIVCVDMFGEGFDLPELKIAAMHDIHKSLAITLQFTGRFTRTKDTIGEATIVANIADPKVEASLRELYAEDSDWNILLRTLSEGATTRQVKKNEFFDAFSDSLIDIPLQNVLPKMSTVVYKTNCSSWRPDKISKLIKGPRLYTGPSINYKDQVAIFITRELEPIAWGDIKELQNVAWDLFIIHWNTEQNLLFINSSNNKSLHEDLAKAIAGEDTQLIRGETVFRALEGIHQLILLNLGLSHSLSYAVRFTMYVGSDIRQGLAEAHTQGKVKSNLFAKGYAEGEKATIGCSYKGRLWSYKVADDISEWVDWCKSIGEKLINPNISTDKILKNVIIPEQIQIRPPFVPLVIEWSENFIERNEDSILIEIDGHSTPFFEASLELVEQSKDGPINFVISIGEKKAVYTIRFNKESVDYLPVGKEIAEISVSKKRRSLSDWFQQEPPIIRFENGSFLIYNNLCTPPSVAERKPFNKEHIQAWDWQGIDIGKESQINLKLRQDTVTKQTDSIQYKVIQELLSPNMDIAYDIIIDDDDAYEAADIVAIKVAGDKLLVHLYHCKFTSEDKPGARVNDLYAVCGQAQRSVYWKSDPLHLIAHLRLRNLKRLENIGISRFERGDLEGLAEITNRIPFLKPDFRITIVQPGLSKSSATNNVLELLSVTELYLKETYGITLDVIGSE